MTTAADDRAVEEAFEASLAGRPVPGEAAGLAAFTSAVRGSATQPGRPNAALAELLSTGLLTDQSSPSTRTAPAAGPLPSRSVRSRTRRRFTVIFSTLVAKFLAAGAVAQAATGAGVVVVVVTGAGATGALPDGAQKTFDSMTGIEQPADLTNQEGSQPVAGGELAKPTDIAPVVAPVESGAPQVSEDPQLTEEELAEQAAAAAKAAWLEGPVDGQTFGDWVSEGKHEGWATGAIVSNMAHKRNEAAKAAREAAKAAARAAQRQDDDADENENETEVEHADHADEQESEVESSDDDGDHGGHGGGNGNGKGHGGRD